MEVRKVIESLEKNKSWDVNEEFIENNEEFLQALIEQAIELNNQ